MHDPMMEGEPHVLPVLAGVFAVIVVGGVADLVLDRPIGLLTGHVVVELALVLFSLGAATYLAVGWYRSSTWAHRLQSYAARAEHERDAWMSRAGLLLEGLGVAVQEQFDAWHLTEAERETALSLLKGGSHKAIAKVSGRSERTVRQHAVAVYRKSGLAGRSALAAFFLEGLLLPPPASRSSAREPDRLSDR